MSAREGATENEMAEWNHQFNGREFEKTLGDSERQGSLACCSPWSHSGLDTMSNRTTTGDSVRPLGQEDPLEEEMATHSSILAWEKSHGQRGLVGYSPWGRKELHMTEWLTLHFNFI